MCGIFPTDCGNNFYKQKVPARMQARGVNFQIKYESYRLSFVPD